MENLAGEFLPGLHPVAVVTPMIAVSTSSASTLSSISMVSALHSKTSHTCNRYRRSLSRLILGTCCILLKKGLRWNITHWCVVWKFESIDMIAFPKSSSYSIGSSQSLSQFVHLHCSMMWLVEQHLIFHLLSPPSSLSQWPFSPVRKQGWTLTQF